MSAADLKDELEAVKRELAEVKKQLAIYQAGAKDLAKTDNDGATMPSFRFPDLPRELRDAIYELCVVPGKVFIYHANTIKTYDMRISPTTPPDIQIFRVCKQISKEARELFEKKNTFILTVGSGTTFSALRMFLRSVRRDSIRRLSISFDYRDYAACVYEGMRTTCIRETAAHRGDADEDDQLNILEGMGYDLEIGMYYRLIDMVADLRLAYLQINLQNCRDPTGAIRRVKGWLRVETVKGISNGIVDFNDEDEEEELPTTTSILNALTEMKVKNIDFMGTNDKDERDYLRRRLASINTKLHFHGVYHGWNCGENEWDENQRIVDYENDDEQTQDADSWWKKDDPEMTETEWYAYDSNMGEGED